MADDPNVDLIGYTFTDAEGRDLTVTETAPWNKQYVLVAGPSGFRTCRSVGLVRARKQGEEQRVFLDGDDDLVVSA